MDSFAFARALPIKASPVERVATAAPVVITFLMSVLESGVSVALTSSVRRSRNERGLPPQSPLQVPRADCVPGLACAKSSLRQAFPPVRNLNVWPCSTPRRQQRGAAQVAGRSGSAQTMLQRTAFQSYTSSKGEISPMSTASNDPDPGLGKMLRHRSTRALAARLA
jgi:hypothetical protein